MLRDGERVSDVCLVQSLGLTHGLQQLMMGCWDGDVTQDTDGGRALSDGFRVHDMLTDGQMAGLETHLEQFDSRESHQPCVLGQSLNHHEHDL